MAAACTARASLSQPGGFAAVAPCDDGDDYAGGTAASTSASSGSPGSFVYEPACLKVSPGSTVTSAGDFRLHPLYPSPSRGKAAGNPITGTSAGSIKEVVFAEIGLYGYYCGIHGAADDGLAMAGVSGCSRNGEPEASPPAGLALDADLAAVGLHDRPGR